VSNDSFTFPSEEIDPIVLIGMKYLPSDFNRVFVNGEFLSRGQIDTLASLDAHYVKDCCSVEVFDGEKDMLMAFEREIGSHNCIITYNG
jgi:hypothetical protein